MNHESLLKQHKSLLTGRWITDLANTSAFIFSEIPRLNWVGFYLNEGGLLTLGPFQGLPACTEIPFSKGVCGKAAMTRQTILVKDVHAFEGHITCDPASRSEVVVPMIRDEKILGVFDIDSPIVARFEEDEKKFFEAIVAQLLNRRS